MAGASLNRDWYSDASQQPRFHGSCTPACQAGTLNCAAQGPQTVAKSARTRKQGSIKESAIEAVTDRLTETQPIRKTTGIPSRVDLCSLFQKGCHEVLQVQKVAHGRLTDGARAQPLFNVAIRHGYPVMLTKVFRPGTHDKCLEITVGELQISTNSLSRRTVAEPDASALAHRLDKLRSPLWMYVIFDRD